MGLGAALASSQGPGMGPAASLVVGALPALQRTADRDGHRGDYSNPYRNPHPNMHPNPHPKPKPKPKPEPKPKPKPNPNQVTVATFDAFPASRYRLDQLAEAHAAYCAHLKASVRVRVRVGVSSP